MAPLPRAEIDPTLSVGGEDIKARKVDTRLSVEVQVNGKGPNRFLVDSGADTSVVGLGIARAQQLPLGTPVILNSMTGGNVVDRVQVASLTLGQSTVSNLQLPALNEEDLGGQGMIGIDALVRRRLMMDFDRKIIKVEDAAKPSKPLPGEIVVVGKRRRGQLILTHVKTRGISLDAVIDTGSELTIGNTLLRQQLVRRRQPFTKVTAIGVTGERVDLEVAIIPELVIGPIVLRDLPVAFADLPPFRIFGLDQQPALFLGTDMLQAFRRVSLDFHHRKVRFQLRRCRPDSIVVNRTPSSSFMHLPSGGGPELCG